MNALLVVDIQNELVGRNLYEKEKFLRSVKEAISKSRYRKDLIIYIQHNNEFLKEGTFEWEIYGELDRYDSDPVLQKSTGNSFTNKSLGMLLKEKSISKISVCGLVTNGCVRATCLGALANGYDVTLIRSAHTCWGTDAKEKIENTESELFEKGVKLIKLSDF